MQQLLLGTFNYTMICCNQDVRVFALLSPLGSCSDNPKLRVQLNVYKIYFTSPTYPANTRITHHCFGTSITALDTLWRVQIPVVPLRIWELLSNLDRLRPAFVYFFRLSFIYLLSFILIVIAINYIIWIKLIRNPNWVFGERNDHGDDPAPTVKHSVAVDMVNRSQLPQIMFLLIVDTHYVLYPCHEVKICWFLGITDDSACSIEKADSEIPA